MSTKIDISELDFAQIKENLKEFLSNQDQFADYDFAGSGMNILLDVLAVNTMLNSFYLSMATNEAFLDSAQFRNNIVSRAKAIGYRPTSRRSAIAHLDIQIFPDDAPASITIPEGTKFTTVLDSVPYTFATYDSYVCVPVGGLYLVKDLEVIEGERLTHRFVVDGTRYSPDSIFELPNPGVDTSLLRVRVQTSSSNMLLTTHTLADDINELDGESFVYFLQEGDGLVTQLHFGDGIVGHQLSIGNIIVVDYTVSSGTAPNLTSSFEAEESVGGYTNYIITAATPAAGGMNEETDASIKFLAPLAYQAQNRAVTKTDYEILVKKDFPAVDSVRVWGGEENDPPYYGKVFVSLKPTEGLAFSTALKDHIANTIIRKRNMVSIEVVMVDPEYLFIAIDTTVNFRSLNTTASEGTIRGLVQAAIVSFNETELEKFQSVFRYSKLVRAIDDAHNSIQNSQTSIRLKYRFYPSFSVAESRTLCFSNAINPARLGGLRTLSSTSFLYKGFTCYLRDDGEGTVFIYRLVDGLVTVVEPNIGTIDYTTGKVTLAKFLIGGIPSGAEYVEVTVRPVAQDIVSVRNQIIVVDTDDISVTMINESVR